MQGKFTIKKLLAGLLPFVAGLAVLFYGALDYTGTLSLPFLLRVEDPSSFIFAGIIAAAFGAAILTNKVSLDSKMLTRIALLIALNIILERVLSLRIPLGGVEGMRIGIGTLPVILAGVFMGPLAGGLVGGIGDLVGYFVNPIGPYMPHFTMTAALRGIIPGLIILLAVRGRQEVGIFPLFLAACATFIIVDIFMVPYFIETLFGVMRVVTVPPRIVEAIVTIPAYTALLVVLGRVMERVAPRAEGGALHVSGKLW